MDAVFALRAARAGAGATTKAEQRAHDHGSREGLRQLLAEYETTLRSVDDIRYQWRQALPRRFLTARIRRSVVELERSLHADRALGKEVAARDELLTDLSHFRESLRTPLTSFQRTLVVVAIVLVAQLLGRLPLIPIVQGAARSPATGSLNEALDLDPGHVAKTIADLVGSPLSTVTGAIFTLAAATFIVLSATAWGFRRARHLFGGPFYIGSRSRRRHPAAALPGLEERVFQAFSTRPPVGPTHDLNVCASLAIGLVTLGTAWYVAFLHGLLRRTPSFDDTYIAYHAAIVRTEHPSFLGAAGIAFIVTGTLIGLALRYAHPQSRLPAVFGRSAAEPGSEHARRRRSIRVLTMSISVPAVAAAVLILVAGAAMAWPLKRVYDEPRMIVHVADVPVRDLLRQPILAVGMSCQPTPCSVASASIHLATPSGFSGSDSQTILQFDHPSPLPLMQSLPAGDSGRPPRRPDPDRGWRTAHDPFGPRLRVTASQVVNIVSIPGAAMSVANETLRGGRRVVPSSVGASDYATALFVQRGLRRMRFVFSAYGLAEDKRIEEQSQRQQGARYHLFGLVLSDADSSRLLRTVNDALVGRRRHVAGQLALTIKMGNKMKRAVRLPVVLR